MHECAHELDRSEDDLTDARHGAGPYNVNPTNHLYFADSTGTSRSFQFAPGPRVLNGMRVYSTTPGPLTLSDDAGQTHSREVTTGSMQFVTTGWTRTATTVTVSFTNAPTARRLRGLSPG